MLYKTSLDRDISLTVNMKFSYLKMSSSVLTFLDAVSSTIPDKTSTTIQPLNFFFGGYECDAVYYNSTTISCDNLSNPPTSSFTISLHLDDRSVSVTNIRFRSPIITKIVSTADVFPTSGGIPIVIYGVNFNEETVLHWNSKETPVYFVSSTQFNVTLPPGSSGSPSSVVLTNSDGFSSPAFSVVYSSPRILAVEGDDGFPIDGNVMISIMGENFPVSDELNITILINDNECSDPQVDDDAITCLLPPGTGGGNTISLFIEQTLAHSAPLFHYNSPLVTSLSGDTPTTGGTSLFLSGHDLGLSSSLVTVEVGRRLCEEVVVISSSSLSCVLPPGSGVGHGVVVDVDGLRSSSEVHVDYDPPLITSVDPGHLSLSGELRLQGENFGVSFEQVSINFDPFMTCTEISITDPHKEITCHGFSSHDSSLLATSSFVSFFYCLAGFGSFKVLILLDDDVVSSFTRQYDSPIIDDVYYDLAPTTGGSTISVIGKNFGLNSTCLVHFDSNVVAETTSTSDSELSFLLVPGQGSFKLSVEIGSLSSNLIEFLYDKPTLVFDVIPEFEKRFAIINHDSKSIRINGSNFGTVESEIDLEITNQEGTSSYCDSVSLIEPHSTFDCLLSEFPTGPLIAAVNISSVQSKSFGFFLSPFIFDPVQSTSINTDGSSSIKIKGINLNFLSTSGSVSSHFSFANSTIAADFVSSTSIKLKVPSSQGFFDLFFSGNVFSTNSITLSFARPIIIEVVSESSFPTKGGVEVFVLGKNLGNDESLIGVTINNDMVSVDVDLDQNTLTFILPSGSGNSKLIVTVDDVASEPFILTYDSPVIDSVTSERSNFPTFGDYFINIYGSNFSSNVSVIRVLVNTDSECDDVTLIDGGLACRLPPVQGKFSISVSVNELLSNHFELISDPPLIESILEGGIIDLSNPFLIEGQNFGSIVDSASIDFDSFSCPRIELDHTWIKCYDLNQIISPGDLSGSFSIKITISNQSTTVDDVSFSPSIIDIVPVNDDFISTAGTKMLITGLNWPDEHPLIEIDDELIDFDHRESSSSVVFDFPEGFGSKSIAVVFSFYKTNSVTVSYSLPSIDDVTFSDDVIPTTGDVIGVIGGQNFGPNHVKLVLEYFLNLIPMNVYFLLTL
ncbi:hypothetical protein GEMRC1_008745 [Eukaryota sp. GEM-RC1]